MINKKHFKSIDVGIGAFLRNEKCFSNGCQVSIQIRLCHEKFEYFSRNFSKFVMLMLFQEIKPNYV